MTQMAFSYLATRELTVGQTSRVVGQLMSFVQHDENDVEGTVRSHQLTAQALPVDVLVNLCVVDGASINGDNDHPGIPPAPATHSGRRPQVGLL